MSGNQSHSAEPPKVCSRAVAWPVRPAKKPKYGPAWAAIESPHSSMRSGGPGGGGRLGAGLTDLGIADGLGLALAGCFFVGCVVAEGPAPRVADLALTPALAHPVRT